MKTEYQSFLLLVKEIYSLRSAQALLAWDQETTMPPRGGQGRADSLASLSKVLQEKYCSGKLGDLIETLEGGEGLSAEETTNVKEIKRDRERLLKVPPQLTEELAKTTSLAQQAWTEARPKNDTGSFNPWLKKVFDLSRQLAECLGYEKCAYDALLDQYEPHAKASELSTLLSDLKEKTVPLLQKITHSAQSPDHSIFSQPFPVPSQKMFNNMLLKDMTFHTDAGRLDESAHPFTEGVWPGDVRLTTRYNEGDVLSALFSTIHEGGHGLYEQGFLPKYYGTPMAEAVSLGIHESQSRLWENQVGKSAPFWKHYLPKLRKVFPEQLNDFSFQEIFFSVNRVHPSLIRVEADEISYNLHILLRFEIEKALFEGHIKVDDIEDVWNEKMKRLLGLVPDSPGNGYLQDVHWSIGLIGYFPTYALGNLYAAQLFHTLKQERPDLEENIEKGNFHPLREWLRNAVHKHGRKHSPNKLIRRITGSEPSITHFQNYLTEKYTRLYNL